MAISNECGNSLWEFPLDDEDDEDKRKRRPFVDRQTTRHAICLVRITNVSKANVVLRMGNDSGASSCEPRRNDEIDSIELISKTQRIKSIMKLTVARDGFGSTAEAPNNQQIYGLLWFKAKHKSQWQALNHQSNYMEILFQFRLDFTRACVVAASRPCVVSLEIQMFARKFHHRGVAGNPLLC